MKSFCFNTLLLQQLASLAILLLLLPPSCFHDAMQNQMKTKVEGIPQRSRDGSSKRLGIHCSDATMHMEEGTAAGRREARLARFILVRTYVCINVRT